MLRLTAGGGDCWAWVYRACPTANVVNATGMVGMIGFPAASCRPPIRSPVRSGFELPSLKMMTPDAPAAWAFWAFTPKLHPPRWISATCPATKPLKSLALHPLVELGVVVGGITMPPTGCTVPPVTVPVLCPGPQSVLRAKSADVGEVWLNAGMPV